MTNVNDGGPVFPQKRLYRDSQGIDYEVQETGMTLRDWFAGQALANRYSQDANNDKRVAKWAYQVADAMLEARK